MGRPPRLGSTRRGARFLLGLGGLRDLRDGFLVAGHLLGDAFVGVGLGDAQVAHHEACIHRDALKLSVLLRGVELLMSSVELDVAAQVAVGREEGRLLPNPPTVGGANARGVLVTDLAAAGLAGALRRVGHGRPEARAAEPLGAQWIATVEEPSRPAARKECAHARIPGCDQIGQTAAVLSHVNASRPAPSPVPSGAPLKELG